MREITIVIVMIWAGIHTALALSATPEKEYGTASFTYQWAVELGSSRPPMQR